MGDAPIMVPAAGFEPASPKAAGLQPVELVVPDLLSAGIGGSGRSRTGNLLGANQAFSLLNYGPIITGVFFSMTVCTKKDALV